MDNVYSFIFAGKVLSKKNNKIALPQKGRVISNPEVQKNIKAIRATATEIATEKNWKLRCKQPFCIVCSFWCAGWGRDVDGMVTTILDAFEGIVYDDDKYCVEVRARKIVDVSADLVSVKVVFDDE